MPLVSASVDAFLVLAIAIVVPTALLFRRQLKRGELSPDKAKDGAFCMDSWRYAFRVCHMEFPCVC